MFTYFEVPYLVLISIFPRTAVFCFVTVKYLVVIINHDRPEYSCIIPHVYILRSTIFGFDFNIPPHCCVLFCYRYIAGSNYKPRWPPKTNTPTFVISSKSVLHSKPSRIDPIFYCRLANNRVLVKAFLDPFKAEPTFWGRQFGIILAVIKGCLVFVCENLGVANAVIVSDRSRGF